MYWRMKMQRSKTDACHLWALLCEGKLCGWVRKASAQAVGFMTQFLLSYFVARETIRLCRGNPKLETLWDARPTFWSPVFAVLFFPVLVRAKAIEETCGAACHHVARFLHALACYIATQQFHEARSLLCGAVWPLSHDLRALCSWQPEVHFGHHVFLHTGAILTTKVPAEMVLHWTFWSFTEKASDHFWKHFGRDLACSCILVSVINFWRAGRWAIFPRIHDAKTYKNHVTFERFIAVSFF